MADLSDIPPIVLHRSSAIAPGMSPILVVIELVISKLVLQVSRSPEECLIQQLSPDASN